MIELATIFINNIVPILLIAAIGYWANRQFQLDDKTIGRLIFNVFSPALIFHALATTPVSPLELGQLALAVVIYHFGLLAVAYPVARRASSDRVTQVGIMLSGMLSNSGNYGMPLILLAFGEVAFSRAAIIFVMFTILTYTVGVYIASSGRQSARVALLNSLKQPVMYVAIAGLVINQLGIILPTALDNTLVLLKGATFPAMLILLGMQLSQARLSSLGTVAVGVGLRMLAAPLVALLVVVVMQLPPPSVVGLILQAAMPIAVVTTIFATEFDLNREQISSGVMLSTLLSPVTLSVLIYVLRETVFRGG